MIKKTVLLPTAFILFTVLSGFSGPIVYAWTGNSSTILNDAGNWSPSGIPTESNGDTAGFSGKNVAGLTPGGLLFTAASASFSSGNYSFASKALGESIAFGNGTLGGVSVSSATVNFNDQEVFLNNNMSWNVSGGSSITSSGTLNFANGGTGNVLTLAFGASQTNNVAQFQYFNFGTTGSLSVSNWGGTPGRFGGTNNQLRFGSDPSAYLSNIKFTVGASTFASTTRNSGSYWEVVPVPEPATIALVFAGMTCIAGLRRRA